MNLPPEIRKAIDAMGAQSSIFQEGLGHLLTSSRNVITYSDPDIRNRVQNNLDHIIEGAGLTYLFALWEEFGLNNIEQQFLLDNELEVLRAYKHLRHSYSHGIDGARANQNRSHFEAYYNSGGFSNSVSWDQNSDKIDLSNGGCAIRLKGIMDTLTKKIISRGANNRDRTEWVSGI